MPGVDISNVAGKRRSFMQVTEVPPAGCTQKETVMLRVVLQTATIVLLLLALSVSSSAQGEAYLGPHRGIQKASDADDANYLGGGTLRCIGSRSEVRDRVDRANRDADPGRVRLLNHEVEL